MGRERNSAFWKSSSSALLRPLSADASPNWAIVASRMGALERGGGRQGRVDELLGRVEVAGELEVDEHGPAVLGDVAGVARLERVLDLADALRLLELRHDVADDGRVLRVADLQAVPALDEHGFTGLVGEVGRLDDAVTALRLAVAHVLVGERLLADGAADHGGEDHEQEPSGDGLLAVLRAPSAGAGREAAVLHVWGAPAGREGLRVARSSVTRPRRSSNVGSHTSCACGSAPPTGGAAARPSLLKKDDQQDDDDDEGADPDVHVRADTLGARPGTHGRGGPLRPGGCHTVRRTGA